MDLRFMPGAGKSRMGRLDEACGNFRPVHLTRRLILGGLAALPLVTARSVRARTGPVSAIMLPAS